jgi:hypothetical protein
VNARLAAIIRSSSRGSAHIEMGWKRWRASRCENALAAHSGAGEPAPRMCRGRQGHDRIDQRQTRRDQMIILGLILLILGILLGIGILYTIGIVLIVVGAVLWLLGSMDRAVGGRRHYW